MYNYKVNHDNELTEIIKYNGWNISYIIMQFIARMSNVWKSSMSACIAITL
jgi:hypothetical protein